MKTTFPFDAVAFSKLFSQSGELFAVVSFKAKQCNATFQVDFDSPIVGPRGRAFFAVTFRRGEEVLAEHGVLECEAGEAQDRVRFTRFIDPAALSGTGFFNFVFGTDFDGASRFLPRVA
ncbi:MAG: hypothetical protein KF745_12890 [Phycisphaeraceae bacterium]|nr:hypothetical protein [Phycisphaeraceae bacterium]